MELNQLREAKPKYDHIIVGAGPSGLTLAWILANFNQSTLIIDREASIGGCHRVRRVDGMFTEHGPRIYSYAYLNFREIFSQLGGDFDRSFKPYNFNITELGGEGLLHLEPFEIFYLSLAYFQLFINPDYGRDQTVLDYLSRYQFTEKTIDYLDRVCRLTDGAGVEVYTLYEFLQLLNQNFFYQIVQPTKPTDRHLFPLWQRALKQTKLVDLLLNHEVTSINQSNSIINQIDLINLRNNQPSTIKLSNSSPQTTKLTLAIPPKYLVKLLRATNDRLIQSSFSKNFQQLINWEKKSRYFTYIPITFHFNTKLDLPKIWGFPKNDWGLAYIVLDDYMEFDHPSSKTVITTCLSYPDRPSKHTGLTVDQSDQKQLLAETFRQLKEIYPQLPQPTRTILSPGVYREAGTNRWETKDSAFILSTAGFLTKQQSQTISNLYNLGPHNGHQRYDFTSMESSVTNAFHLSHLLLGQPAKERFPIKKPTTILGLARMASIIITIMIAIWLIRRR